MVITIDVDSLYSTIKNAFKDLEGETKFLEFPDPEGDKLANKSENHYLAMRNYRHGYVAAYNFDLIEFHNHLEMGTLDLKLEDIKSKIEYSFKNRAVQHP